MWTHHQIQVVGTQTRKTLIDGLENQFLVVLPTVNASSVLLLHHIAQSRSLEFLDLAVKIVHQIVGSIRLAPFDLFKEDLDAFVENLPECAGTDHPIHLLI